MVSVIGVRFKSAGKVYYFDPNGLDIKAGDSVIVETARGLEFGTVFMDPTRIKEEDIVSPLKKVVRLATPDDISKHNDNEKKKKKALSICQEKIAKRGLSMKLVDVEYTFDNNKIIFYFIADGRVDFRELVKDLAAVFRMRIELRQIGVRDEAKMLGGIGYCGRSLCCGTWLSDFEPVSIKMAKVQDLSLNPAKISGVCGRLMCCLKFENDLYMELRKGLPENGETVYTKDGMATVVDRNILESKVRVRLYTEEQDENGAKKLGNEILTFDKKDVRRLGDHERNLTQDTNSILREADSEYIDELKTIICE